MYSDSKSKDNFKEDSRLYQREQIATSTVSSINKAYTLTSISSESRPDIKNRGKDKIWQLGPEKEETPRIERHQQTYWPDNKYNPDPRPHNPEQGAGNPRNCLLQERSFPPTPEYSDRLLRAKRAGLLVSVGASQEFARVSEQERLPYPPLQDPRELTRNPSEQGNPSQPMDLQDSSRQPPPANLVQEPQRLDRRQDSELIHSRDVEMKDIRSIPDNPHRNHPDSSNMQQRFEFSNNTNNVTESRGLMENLKLQNSQPRGYREYEQRCPPDARAMENMRRQQEKDKEDHGRVDSGGLPEERLEPARKERVEERGRDRYREGESYAGRKDPGRYTRVGEERRYAPDGEGGYAGFPEAGGAQYSQASWRCAGERGRMGSSEQYCLRWNSYETNILDTFGGLLDSEALSDVTLFCEGESFKAHRLVLAACSTHFSKIFSTSPLNGQLIVILDGTRAQDLQILLQFMYRGVAFLPSDRIESVLRTGEVLQVKGLFNGGDGLTREREPERNQEHVGRAAWSPPPADSLKKEEVRERDASPVPSGRIAVPPEIPISHALPIFPPQPYPRAFPTSIPSLYQNFAGFSRPESTGSKPTSTSALSFSSTKSGISSPISGRESGNQYKFSPREREQLDNGPFETVTNGKPELSKLGRSPPVHRPASEPFERPNSSKRLTGDSIAESGASPSQSMRFDEPDRQRMKTEEGSSPGDRNRSFSGDFPEPRDTLSRMSSQSTPSTIRTDAAEDLRTNDTEERLKRENNQDFLRRLAQVNSERENQLATIQKMDLIRQATAARDGHFLASAGGFSGPLTAPLGIPASDLARIAQTVPDPNAVPGEPTSGTGTKLKCPFCERTYGYETNLRAHIRQRHQGIRVPCPFCHRSFTRNNTVRRHIAREHRNQVKPNMIPTKFGQTKVIPDPISYPDSMNVSQP